MNASQPNIALHPCTGCCTQVFSGQPAHTPPARVASVMVRPIDLRPGDRLLLAGGWRTVESRPCPVMVCGKLRCRVQLDHAGSYSWPMDHATSYEGVEIATRPAHDRRVA